MAKGEALRREVRKGKVVHGLQGYKE